MKIAIAMIVLALAGGRGAGAEGLPQSAWDVRPLLVGSKAPSVGGLVDERGEPFDLGAATKGRPAVLVFYRGHW